MNIHARRLLALYPACTCPLLAFAAETQPAAVVELVAAARQHVTQMDMQLADWLATGYILTEQAF